jgi:diaminopimelate epimerase
MKNPTGLKSNLMLRVTTHKARAYFVDTGSPHVVIPLRKGVLDRLDVVTIGRRIAHSRRFGSNGTNVNFVDVDDDKMLHMRTYERGVEAETLACGTGSIACALIAHRKWKLESPVTILARSGKKLQVTFRSDGISYKNVVLSGPAEVIFMGSIDV